MKLLHVVPGLDPSLGGIGEVIRQWQRQLPRLGHTSDILCLDPPGSPWLGEIPGRVITPGTPTRGAYRQVPGLIPWLEQHLPGYDYALLHGLWTYGSPALRQASRRTGVPYAVMPHGMLDGSLRVLSPIKHLKKKFYWKSVEHLTLADARLTLFTCEEERRAALHTFQPYRREEAVIHLGTEPPPSSTETRTRAFLDRLPALRDTPFLLFLGRIHRKKGIDLLIQAAGLLSGKGPFPHLVIAGPVEDRRWHRHLRGFANAHPSLSIHWAGMLEGDAKWGALQEAEALVLPSHQENFGMAVAEALAMGTPVLVSHRVNIWREIAEDGAGLAAEDSLEGVGAMLAHWQALTPATRGDMGRRAADCFRNRFAARSSAEHLVATLEKSLERTH